ncbi:SMEK domain-containing protein [Priestia filamentosa]|uniref:SMEK domain-containing protein n=1 Tax=Priestia filamentosa TaxID=1402861 RepID=UPI003981E854
MLSRGKLLGEILDGLSQLSFSLQTRGKVGLFDLNRYCEDFAKDLLNLIYGYKLVNLNDVRLNEPGIDLGDMQKKIAFQITSNKKTPKVIETLEKISDEHKVHYNKFKILILGTKQKSYTIPEDLKSATNFNDKDDIMDFQDLESKILSLSLEKIKGVYDFLKENLVRVYSDLGFDETPDGESVTIMPAIEKKPEFKFSNCNLLIKHLKVDAGNTYTKKMEMEFNDAFERFTKVLMSLPKITREFFYALVYRTEEVDTHGNFELDDETMRRFLHISEERYNQELRILKDKNLVSYDEIDEFHHTITIGGPAADEFVLESIKVVTDREGIDLRDILIALRFSLFEI